MKYFTFAFLLIIVVSCSNLSQDSKSEKKKDQKKNESNNFKVIKSGVFWNELDEGKYQIISSQNGFLETIDKEFGFNKLSDNSYLYLLVKRYNSNEFNLRKDSIYGSIDKYFLLKNKSTEAVSDLTQNLDDYFSSPILKGDKLYFWGIEFNKNTDTLSKIYATEFNLITKNTIKYFLFKDDLGTDFRGYFREPYIKNNKIIFEDNSNQKWIFNKDFELEK